MASFPIHIENNDATGIFNLQKRYKKTTSQTGPRRTFVKCGCGKIYNQAKPLEGFRASSCVNKCSREDREKTEIAFMYYNDEYKKDEYKREEDRIDDRYNRLVYVNRKFIINKTDPIWKKLKLVMNVEESLYREINRTDFRKKFVLKIENYYLQAKYNPRTEIGERFVNKLYSENFGE